ncbi:MAG: hypothetical protein IJZ75_01815 [Clostridia bacterium]|nr:hypothetical protein [Clostridia bacterium]
MKNLKTKLNKIMSVFLVLAIVLSLFTGVSITTMAATPDANYTKVADAATLDGWKSFFGSTVPSTENAGGVWTDKSVFADNSAFQNLVDADGNPIASPTVDKDGFLVALSAIASNKTIVGYSHIPTDTVLALDISGSMGPSTWGSSNNDAVEELVLAANAAITTLLELNNNNRVGVLLYSAEYDQGNDFNYYTLLPIDRYTATSTTSYDNGTPNDKSDDRTIYQFLETNNDADVVGIKSGVKNGNNTAVRQTDIDVVGGTYIQGGLSAVADMFEARKNANDTVVKGDGFQSGTERKPVIVLMSDGAPTYATNNYTNPGDYNIGNGSSATAINAFLTQLTAAYVKQEVSGYYGNEALFYTLGLGVGNSNNAQSVLDPANNHEPMSIYWSRYAAATAGASVEITDNFSITKDAAITDIVYSDLYASADTKASLFNAFDKIVKQIIIQSLYRPTLVEENNAHMEGYIEFIDDIGDYLEVEKIDGILIGNQLFTGEKLSRNFTEDGGDLGTVTDPNTLGDNLIWSVKERLGIENTQDARDLVELAYGHGQLSYTDENNWSNYIGWYADENGKYIGFWDDETHTYEKVPANAKYINKSYGMLGKIVEGHNESDLMYISIQVHTEIVPQNRFNLDDTDLVMPGHAQVIFRVPASLIPVVTYEVELEGTGYEDARNITMDINDTEPIRLLFEVGIRDDVNEYNITETLGDNKKGTDGKYYFYTNEWSAEQFQKEINADSTDHIDPKDAINTVAYFEPNLQNERYYYTEPTPIYVKDGNSYVKYTSSTDPNNASGEYFRKINVFELTENLLDGNAATLADDVFEAISAKALSKAEKTDEGWVIPKNTIHRVYDEIETPKKASGSIPANVTGTLNYSYYPTVEQIEGVHYYADAILGNNGLLTVTPETGIKITKEVDATLLGSTAEYEFEVTLNGKAGENFAIVYLDDNGNYIESSTTLDHTLEIGADDKGTLKLKAGWAAYIIGLSGGETYTVNEVIPTDANYKVSNNPVTSGTVTQYEFADVDFVNTLVEDGSLVISKRVTHPFATAPDALFEKTFNFKAVLSNGGQNYSGTVKAYHSTSPDTEETLNVVDNEIQGITLKANEAMVIHIDAGWSVEVTEVGIPEGFTLSNTNSTIPQGAQTIVVNQNVVYEFVNDYAHSAVNPNVNISASKEFTGRPWTDADVFTFELRKYNTETARFETMATEQVRGDNQSTVLSFGNTLTAAIKADSLSAVGTYHYSIVEVIPDEARGITYDGKTRDFDVVVTDEDADGKLEVAAVTNTNNTDIAEANGFTVTVDKFVNTYKADGIAEIIFEVTKNVDTADNSNYSPEGFEFGVYNYENGVVGDLVGSLNTTDQNGIAQFIFAYNADNVDYAHDKVIKYVIRETNTQIPGMVYANDIPVTVTVKDMLDGTIDATVDIGTKDADDVVTVAVTNNYNPDNTKTSVVIDVEKKVENKGTASIGPENFEFSLDDGTDELKVKTDKNGKAQFKLDYTAADVGETYTYVLSEVKGDVKDVEYSEEKYEISVTISLDSNNKVVAQVLFEGEDYTDKDIVADFTNIYKGNLPVEPAPEPTPEPTPAPAPAPAPTQTTSPQTGEGVELTLLLGLLFVSGGLAVYTAFRINKTEEENS